MTIQIRGGGGLLNEWYGPFQKGLAPEVRGIIKMFELHNVTVTFWARPVSFETLGSADIIDGKAIAEIYLSNHKRRPAARRTARHELYHIYQLQNGYPVNENEAELFAQQGIISS